MIVSYEVTMAEPENNSFRSDTPTQTVRSTGRI